MWELWCFCGLQEVSYVTHEYHMTSPFSSPSPLSSCLPFSPLLSSSLLFFSIFFVSSPLYPPLYPPLLPSLLSSSAFSLSSPLYPPFLPFLFSSLLSFSHLFSSLSPPWFLVLNTTSHSSKKSTALFICASRKSPRRSWAHNHIT